MQRNLRARPVADSVANSSRPAAPERRSARKRQAAGDIGPTAAAATATATPLVRNKRARRSPVEAPAAALSAADPVVLPSSGTGIVTDAAGSFDELLQVGLDLAREQLMAAHVYAFSPDRGLPSLGSGAVNADTAHQPLPQGQKGRTLRKRATVRAADGTVSASVDVPDQRHASNAHQQVRVLYCMHAEIVYHSPLVPALNRLTWKLHPPTAPLSPIIRICKDRHARL